MNYPPSGVSVRHPRTGRRRVPRVHCAFRPAAPKLCHYGRGSGSAFTWGGCGCPKAPVQPGGHHRSGQRRVVVRRQYRARHPPAPRCHDRPPRSPTGSPRCRSTTGPASGAPAS